jgi:hypothetical protein
MERMTEEDIRDPAAKLFTRDDLVIVCVGSRSKMEAGDGEHPVKLADFGPIHSLGERAKVPALDTPSAVALRIMQLLAAGDVEGLLPHVGGALTKRLETEQAKEQLKMQAGPFSAATYEVTNTEVEGERHGHRHHLDDPGRRDDEAPPPLHLREANRSLALHRLHTGPLKTTPGVLFWPARADETRPTRRRRRGALHRAIRQIGPGTVGRKSTNWARHGRSD